MEAIDVMTIRRLSGLASRFADDTYGELTGVGMPRLDSGGSIVEYPLVCQTNYGSLRVGLLSVGLDGSILTAPTRDEVSASVDDLIRRLDSCAAVESSNQSGSKTRRRKAAPVAAKAPHGI